MPTRLDSVRWIHGAMDCVTSTDPLIQVEEFDEDTFILRLSKCFSYEGNFMHLIFGNTRAILFDTGAPPDAHNLGAILPIRKTVDSIVSTWLEDRRPVRFELIVAHTHGHRDHAFWDNQFEGRKNTTIVRPTTSSACWTGRKVRQLSISADGC
jgi:hydroxyacylglutathione hydrolase